MKTALEIVIQSRIAAALGAKPGVLLMRNAIYHGLMPSGGCGEYGLGVGTPDLVGALAPFGRWFALEVKQPGKKATAEQAKTHRIWRSFGIFVAVVHSVEEAEAALDRARKGLLE